MIMNRVFKYSSVGLMAFFLGLWVGGCRTIPVMTLLSRPSPHELYVKSLEQSGMSNTAMGKAWLDEGNPATHDSVMVTLPYRETGYFASGEPQARFYRFDVKAGEVLVLTSLVKAKENVRVFADVFMLEDMQWKRKEHADTSLTINYEFVNTGTVLVRLQPELLVNAFYSITLSVTPVLINPVKGASNKSIGSFYGDARDGGKRKHEGVDIFAPKGTEVVAPTAGTVTRVANGGLGGKTIWMNDTKRGHSYYFAHLDEQYVKQGARVRQGEVLGTVGNTGNAQNTPSHLHFGVYERNAIDPIAYIRTMEKLVNELAPDTLFQSIVFKVKQKNAMMYSGPSEKSVVQTQLLKDVYLKIIAQSGDWYRVLTADDFEGFVKKDKMLAADKGNKIVLKKPVWLLTEAVHDAVPVMLLEKGSIEGLALYKNYRYVKTKDGVVGWIDTAEL